MFYELKKYAVAYEDRTIQQWSETLKSAGIHHESNLFSLDLQTLDELLAQIDDFVLRSVVRKIVRSPDNKKHHHLLAIENSDLERCEHGGWETPFDQYFQLYKNAEIPLAAKWKAYFSSYDRHFSRFRDKNLTFLEIGVQSGGSMLMWRWYFGEGFRYIGIDINDQTRKFASPWSEIIIGDTGSKEFWRNFKATHANIRLDILLDDGGHSMNQQITTFEEMYDFVTNDGGIYACEDLHTSYSSMYGGSADVLRLDRKAGETTVFMDVIKHMVDYINGNRSAPLEEFNRHCVKHPECSRISKSLKSIHVYDSIFFAEKGNSSMELGEAGMIKIPYYSVDWDGKLSPIEKYETLLSEKACRN